jgi:hypothetical protein
MVEGKNDREAGIIAGAFLESLLFDYLRKIIVDSSFQRSRDLFEYPRPLSSFGAMMSLALAFGLISEFEFAEIRIVKKIRDLCAHSLSVSDKDAIDFDKSPVRDILREWYPRVATVLLPSDKRKELEDTLEATLQYDSRMLFRLIFCKAALTLYARIAMAKPFTAPSEIKEKIEHDLDEEVQRTRRH